MQGDLVGEGLEVLVAGDEVGLALDLDHRPDLVVGVDVGGDDALFGAAPFALGGGGLALHPQQLDRPLDVAVGLGQRRFAVHHRRPGPIPERLHVSGGNAHFASSSLLSSLWARSARRRALLARRGLGGRLASAAASLLPSAQPAGASAAGRRSPRVAPGAPAAAGGGGSPRRQDPRPGRGLSLL